MTLHPAVTNLITARRIEQVPADRASALVRLTRAEAKLQAARKIAAIDVEVAYVTGYDATRIAVTAHMLAAGYRVRAEVGVRSRWPRPQSRTRRQRLPAAAA